MSRSSKKKPYIQEKLLKRIEEMNETGKKEVLKTWSRASTIYPQMVGHTIAVHDGRKHVPRTGLLAGSIDILLYILSVLIDQR